MKKIWKRICRHWEYIIGWTIIVLAFVIVIGGISAAAFFSGTQKISINLPIVNDDEMTSWSFKVDGREIPVNSTIRSVKGSLEISVFELQSGEEVDKLNIGSLVYKGDNITYIYKSHFDNSYNKIEELFIEISHLDGTRRVIPLNINQ